MGTGRDRHADEHSTGRRRLTVPEAAQALGVTVDAVRGRIKRETIGYEREGDRVFVVLEADESRTGRGQSDDHNTDQGVLVELLRDQVEYLRGQLEAERRANDENRRLLAAALERIPALEAPPDASESPVTPDEDVGRGTGSAQPQPASSQRRDERPFWQRIFGGNRA